MVVLKGMFLFQVYLNSVSLMDIQWKLGYAALAKPKLLLLVLLWCSVQMEKNAEVFWSLFTSNVLTLTLGLTMS